MATFEARNLDETVLFADDRQFANSSNKGLKSQTHSDYKHDTGNSTDDNPAEVIKGRICDTTEEDISVPEHYNNLSDSHQSPIDDEEEEKIEQEIANRLSHLKINREYVSDNNNRNFELYQSHKSQEWTHDWNSNNRESEVITDNNMDGISDIEDDTETVHVGDEHYQSLFEKHTLLTNTNTIPYKFSWKREFLSNETFLKYAMFYGTIYLITKQSLHRLSGLKSAEIESISTKMILISHAVIAIFNNNEIWNKPHKAMLSPFKDLLNENEVNFMDIQKAFYGVMILLSYLNGTRMSKHRNMKKRANRLYNLICMGCIILMKKYKKIGGLYIYVSYWSELSSLFLNSSKILKWFGNGSVGGYYYNLIKYGGKTSSVIFLLIMIYSKVYLFSKVMIPIIQHYYRNTNQYFGSAASIAFLISCYYKTGHQVIKAFMK